MIEAGLLYLVGLYLLLINCINPLGYVIQDGQPRPPRQTTSIVAAGLIMERARQEWRIRMAHKNTNNSNKTIIENKIIDTRRQ